MPNSEPGRLQSGTSSPADVFAALGDTTRLILVERLCHGGDQSVSQLGAGVPMSRQAVRKHLSVLEHAGLVGSTQRGREQLFSLRRERIEQARSCLDGIAQQWDSMLLRLKDHLEKEP